METDRNRMGQFVRGHRQVKTEAHKAAIAAACKWGLTGRKRMPAGTLSSANRQGYIMVKTEDAKWRGQHIAIAEQMLGREILPSERVHHIDMQPASNAPENLHVYASNAEHTRAHASLNRLVAGLMRDGHVRFDRATGRYTR